MEIVRQGHWHGEHGFGETVKDGESIWSQRVGHDLATEQQQVNSYFLTTLTEKDFYGKPI